MSGTRRPVHFLGSDLHCAQGRGVRQAAAACLEQRVITRNLTLPGHDGDVVLPYCGTVDMPARYDDLGEVVSAAIASAQLSTDELRRTALLIGTSSGDIALHEQHYRQDLSTRSDAIAIRRADYSAAPEWLAHHYGIGGPRYTIGTACSASANALLYAAWMIREGVVEHAIVVGMEIRNSVSILGFNSMLLLARDVCRPFDVAREGIILGEALAATVLGAHRRASCRWQLLGGGTLCDSLHPTRAAPDKIGETLRLALNDAGISSGDIVAIKAHGTGTPGNDLSESLGMREVFGTCPPPFTSIKPVLGHTLGACGLAETLAIQSCLEGDTLPATAGFRDTDPQLVIAPSATNRKVEQGAVLLNFFGFGGNNCCLVMAPC